MSNNISQKLEEQKSIRITSQYYTRISVGARYINYPASRAWQKKEKRKKARLKGATERVASAVSAVQERSLKMRNIKGKKRERERERVGGGGGEGEVAR